MWDRGTIEQFHTEEEAVDYRAKHKGHILKTLFYCSDGMYWFFSKKDTAEHFLDTAMYGKAYYIEG